TTAAISGIVTAHTIKARCGPSSSVRSHSLTSRFTGMPRRLAHSFHHWPIISAITGSARSPRASIAMHPVSLTGALRKHGLSARPCAHGSSSPLDERFAESGAGAGPSGRTVVERTVVEWMAGSQPATMDKLQSSAKNVDAQFLGTLLEIN